MASAQITERRYQYWANVTDEAKIVRMAQYRSRRFDCGGRSFKENTHAPTHRTDQRDAGRGVHRQEDQRDHHKAGRQRQPAAVALGANSCQQAPCRDLTLEASTGSLLFYGSTG